MILTLKRSTYKKMCGKMQSGPTLISVTASTPGPGPRVKVKVRVRVRVRVRTRARVGVRARAIPPIPEAAFRGS